VSFPAGLFSGAYTTVDVAEGRHENAVYKQGERKSWASPAGIDSRKKDSCIFCMTRGYRVLSAMQMQKIVVSGLGRRRMSALRLSGGANLEALGHALRAGDPGDALPVVQLTRVIFLRQ
jgi:hypothetical protein